MKPSNGARRAPMVWRSITCILALWAGALMLAGCARRGPEQTDYQKAQALFKETTTKYHLPSSDKADRERLRLLDKAAAGYQQLLDRYPNEEFWCAQALRSLGNVRAAQGKIDEALAIFLQVASQYSEDRWEVLQALKSAADLCRDSQRAEEAHGLYLRIVNEFSEADRQVMKIIVEAARRELGSR